MAQRTAFLNSQAQGYNQDIHHTMIHNALLAQVGVMFSDLDTKPEFVLGNGTIEAGTAIIKCTRTTGVFAGEEILALFASTVQEPIDVSGNKKVYIEIPEGYINDPSTITDTLTGGQNLGVGVIKSTVAYPSHSNYIPLWEITAGDWAGASDVRPEIKRFGKKDTIAYFDTNGKEQHVILNSASINKFLKSNGPGNAPTMEDPSANAEVLATKSRYIAGENLLKGDYVVNNPIALFDKAVTELNIGDIAANTKRSFKIIGNNITDANIELSLKGFGAPSDNFEVRIETDNMDVPSGTLADPNATATIAGSATSASLTQEILSWTGAFALNDGDVYHIVLQRSGSVSGSNYYVIGVETRNTRAYEQHTYNGASWSTVITTYTPFMLFDGIYSNVRCKTKADDRNMIDFDGVCTLNTTIGNQFVCDTIGVSDALSGLEAVLYYLSNTAGEISTTPGAYTVLAGRGENTGEIRIDNDIRDTVDYDAIVGPTSSADYSNIQAAIDAGKKNIYVREGDYDETYWNLSSKDVTITFESYLASIVFDNTEVHSGEYITLNATTNLKIVGGKIKFALNATNQIAMDGNPDDDQVFVWEKSKILLDNDDVVGRRFNSSALNRYSQGFLNCTFDFLNTGKAPIRISDQQAIFNMCSFNNGNVILGGNDNTRFVGCQIAGLEGIGFNRGYYESCKFQDNGVTTLFDSAGTTTGTSTIGHMINTMIGLAGLTILADMEIQGSVGSYVYLPDDDALDSQITLEEGTLENPGHSNSYFHCETLIIKADMTGCKIDTNQSSCVVTVDATGVCLVGNDIFLGGTMNLSTSADGSVVNGNRFPVGSKVTVDSGCNNAIITSNSNIGSITDNGTATITANNN